MNIFKRIKEWTSPRMQDWRSTLSDAAHSIAAQLADNDRDGLPDRLQAVARYVAVAVETLEVALPALAPGEKRGAERLARLHEQVRQASGKFEADWRIIEPLVSIAVQMMRGSK